MANKQTPCLDHLFKGVRKTFFKLLPPDVDETIRASTEPDDLYTDLQVIDFNGQAIDTHLKSDDSRFLLCICLEDTHYFTDVPMSSLCIRDHMSADHIVYHLLYETLRNYLEVEWAEYVEEKRGGGV